MIKFSIFSTISCHGWETYWEEIEVLKFDNEVGYTLREFKAYCSKNSIRHEKTVIGTPKHNGLAKRMNHTIIKKVKCIIKTTKLPELFWGEATKTTYHLLNISPLVALSFEVQEGMDRKICFLFSLESLHVYKFCTCSQRIEI